MIGDRASLSSSALAAALPRRRETKMDQVRRLLAAGKSMAEIADIVGVPRKFAGIMIWRVNNPGYHRNFMRKKRASDPDYYRKELDQQGEYNRTRRIKI